MLTDDAPTARLPRPLDPDRDPRPQCAPRKEQATPEYYPLTLNALVAACNQRSNRDPVTGALRARRWTRRARAAARARSRLEGGRTRSREVGAQRRGAHGSSTRRTKALMTLLFLRGRRRRASCARGATACTRSRAIDGGRGCAGGARGRAWSRSSRSCRVRPGQKEARWSASRSAAPWRGGATPAVAPSVESAEPLESRVTSLEETDDRAFARDSGC